jgi:hypothetical protein
LRPLPATGLADRALRYRLPVAARLTSRPPRLMVFSELKPAFIPI